MVHGPCWDSAERPAWPHLRDGCALCPRAGLAAAADGLEAALASLVAAEAAAQSEQAEKEEQAPIVIVV